MLVLSRKSGQSFLIGEDIEIEIIEVQGDKAKIGIKAPKDISILRKELLEETEQVNREAAKHPVTVKLEDLGKLFGKK